MERSREELEIENERLRRLLAPVHLFPARFQLTAYQNRALAVIVAAAPRRVTKERIFEAIYFDALEVPDIEIVESVVCKTRRKIRPFNIYNERRLGYFMRADDASALRQMTEEVAA